MTMPGKRASAADSLATLANVVLSASIVLALYFGRELLVPLALAALLTFMLTPLVTYLQRWLGRIGAVLMVVAMMFAATGAVGWVLTRQVIDLANKLPGYQENIQTKLRSIQIPSTGPFARISKTLGELKKELPGGRPADPAAASAYVAKPTRVEIVNGKDQRIEFLQVALTPVLGPLGTTALVLLLLVFMLLEREEIRNRMIRLVGQGRISTTSRVLGDAGARVSKYLLMLTVVNVTYGIPVAVGLYFIGVPNAILWGALATVLRFIPYAGPWIAAAFPIVLSLASSPGWMVPVLTISLFAVLELISNNVIEPWLYGSSIGVTPIALIVAALFWTWLWGPVGLVLATPLTVCLVVMGRNIPKLAFLSIVLSDEEALTPAEDCYQRLLRAGEHDEMELVDQYLKTHPLVELFDAVFLPVVAAAGKDHRQGLLDPETLDFVENGMGNLLDAISPADSAADESESWFCCVPAGARRDQLAGDMLVQLIRQQGDPARNAAAKMTSGALLGWIREAKATVVCISVLEPTSLIHARYRCTKLRLNLPEVVIIVGLWGRSGLAPEELENLRSAGADEIVTTLAEAVARVKQRGER